MIFGVILIGVGLYLVLFRKSSAARADRRVASGSWRPRKPFPIISERDHIVGGLLLMALGTMGMLILWLD
ncbi:MAG TPA: hypothetical protein VFV93_01620 [Thermomicrobiales bacterium]|nr:hypothetical protein [Thermomicrobiales bacterium]